MPDRDAVLAGRSLGLHHVPVPPPVTALGLATGPGATLLAVGVAVAGDDVAWFFLGVGLLGGLVALAAS